MWRWETETRLKEYEPGRVFSVEIRSLVNEEGVRIEWRGVLREKGNKLFYKGRGVSLAIQATRYDVYGEKPLDKYTVTPDPPLAIRRLIELGQLEVGDVTRIGLIKQDIASALQVWPERPEDSDIPIRVIEFSHLFDTPPHAA